MKIVILIFFIKEIYSEVSSDQINLCDSGNNVEYENYTSNLTQNCGCKDESTCIRKCCQDGFVHYHDENPDNDLYISTCIKNETGPFYVPIYDGKTKLSTTEYHFMVGMLNCNNADYQYFKMDNTDPNQIFYIQKDGSLYYPYFEQLYTNERYCVDEEDGLTAYLCFTPEPDYQMEAWIHISAKLVSVVFLATTGFVYALLPERNLYKNSMMNHVFSLIPGYLLLAIAQYSAANDTINNYSLCAVIGYLALYFLISSFFWMNVICIDIWIAFSRLRGFYLQEKIKRNILAIASLYAWGLPLLYDLSIFLLDKYGDETASYYPGIGIQSCFLAERPTLIFYFGPVVVLIVLNLILFVITAVNIQKAKKEASIMENSESRKYSKREDDRFKLYWKLLFVMGLNPVVNTHVIQLIAYSLAAKISHETVIYLWYFKDFSHACYGIMVFLVFVCQKKIWRSLKERFPCIEKAKNKASNTTSTCTTSSENTSAIRLRGIQNLGADVP